jgi:hypothetical protein
MKTATREEATAAVEAMATDCGTGNGVRMRRGSQRMKAAVGAKR